MCATRGHGHGVPTVQGDDRIARRVTRFCSKSVSRLAWRYAGIAKWMTP
ncbi:hypothetical protein [Nitrosomonas mobilis]|nr:hypothetical protein [Nitrosomonas mobilis]